MDEITVARGLFLAFFGLLLIAVFLLPREYVFRGAADCRRWRDLRVWAVVLVLIHVYVYCVF